MAAGSLMKTGAAIVPPAGFIRFCVEHAQECLVSRQQPEIVELTADHLAQLEQVQTEVNAEITPRINPSQSWEYAASGYGDCNTYALTKRRALIALGWPEETLLLAAAYTESGEGHLVLVARTAEGDLVLDNRLPQVVDWTQLPYRWIAVQSQTSPARWLKVEADPMTVADAARSLTPAAALR
ncbi:MAG TPA: transglutaminase-like cysteine peptidase [Stellaceae bacterium]|nr:transglutaminase-like cysteine peptidase [Stellaceae bacterium]